MSVFSSFFLLIWYSLPCNYRLPFDFRLWFDFSLTLPLIVVVIYVQINLVSSSFILPFSSATFAHNVSFLCSIHHITTNIKDFLSYHLIIHTLKLLYFFFLSFGGTQVNQYSYPYLHRNFAEYSRLWFEIARKRTVFVRSIGHSNTALYTTV